MIELTIPGRGVIHLEHLVTDVNGTLALDGQLLEGLPRRLNSLGDRLNIHLLTADTHGRQESIDRLLNLRAVRIGQGREAEQKAEFVSNLGADHVVAIGQGSNDAGMLEAAQIGIGILSQEGIAVDAILAADIIVPDIFLRKRASKRPSAPIELPRK